MADDEYSEEEEFAMIAERRQTITEYLAREGLTHGAVGEYPAFHVSPYLYLFAIESLILPGRIGWWAICGDCPCDYISGDGVTHPSDAIRTFGEQWLRDDIVEAGFGHFPADVLELLRIRGRLLLEIAADDEAFED